MKQPRNTARFIRVAQLLDRLQVSRTTLWRMVRDGKIVKPVRISSRIVVWREEDIAAWFDTMRSTTSRNGDGAGR